MIDLHLHTNHSIRAKDTYLLEQLVRNDRITPTSCSIAETDSTGRLIETAKRKGLSAIAITDHWSTDGFCEARVKAEESGIRCIPGIELAVPQSVDGETHETHVLGYGFSVDDPGLKKLCADAAATCARGVAACLAGLPRIGIEVSKPELQQKHPEGITGWAIRRWLVQQGYAVDKYDATGIQQRAVKRALNDDLVDRPQAIASASTVAEITGVLHRAGATVFLAHPFWLTYPSQGSCSEETVWRYIEAALAAGVDGVEAYAPCHSPRQTQMITDLCRARRIPASGGSDSRSVDGFAASEPVSDDVLVSIMKYRKHHDPWE